MIALTLDPKLKDSELHHFMDQGHHHEEWDPDSHDTITPVIVANGAFVLSLFLFVFLILKPRNPKTDKGQA